ncbi:ATP-dependent clpX [Hyphodiscus hymeniophilus]|uniref:ATP-dependent clpX n=1 Tax=Hyphodiscus hymeniophilus TaxID=353542 RepID=A0A9P6VHQ3_9HELO|nr:ATP-dependent clpX [Hyphodiscus hymeniophilus]
MPAIHRTLQTPRVLLRHPTIRSSSTYRQSDFPTAGHGFTGSYEPGAPVVGPIAQASKSGITRLTPSLLKEHLDKYVVGQTKAKKVTSVAVYNHYQRIREVRRLEAEEQERIQKESRRRLKERERNSHPLESRFRLHLQTRGLRVVNRSLLLVDEFPGHVETVDLNSPPVQREPELGSKVLEDNDVTIIEKSNVLLLGPSGVGKTYILQTLSHILEVPFATVDCSALTQAGYIGTDIESSIERLLLASNHNISKCETGIIFFDEVDKLAKPAVMTHGRDVSGEGVQQGLLKMIEGTTVTVSAKNEKNRSSERDTVGRSERGRDSGALAGPRSDQYTIDTTNILFVFAGAFVGLEKIITSRLQSGTSLGFGAELRSSSSTSAGKPDFPLDHCTPQDLQTYGLIPELLGRIPIITALQPLSLSQLVSILTSPKSSLVKQYTALFKTYAIELKFTSLALLAIAERALDTTSNSNTTPKPRNHAGGIGARGLRSIMESVLGEVMFHGPGSNIRYCLVDEAFVCGQGESKSSQHTTSGSSEDGTSKAPDTMPRCWSRGQGRAFEEAFEKEEAVSQRREEERGRRESGGEQDVDVGTFETYRRVGSSGM